MSEIDYMGCLVSSVVIFILFITFKESFFELIADFGVVGGLVVAFVFICILAKK